MCVTRKLRPIARGCVGGVTAAILLLTVIPPIAQADDAVAATNETKSRALRPADIQERRLPVERISEVLSSDWQPTNLAEYQKLLDAARPNSSSPRTTTIDRADYYAVLTGDTLEAGRLAFHVKRLSPKPELFVLDPLNLAVTELGWKRRRAVWGSIADGRLACLVDRSSGTLSGAWSLKGRRLRRRIDFRVKLTPATVSQIRLQVPAGWMLESSAGQVTGPSPTSTVGWSSWRIDLGSQSSFRLVARRPLDVKPTRPVVLVESDVTHVIRKDVRQLQARFLLDVSGAPAKSMSVRIPEGVNVLSVTYGNEIKLQYRVIQSRKLARQLRIQFAEPILGKSRSITMQAVVEGQSANGQLPQIRPLTGAFLSGTVYVRVASPLTIQSISMTGMRQASPINETRAGETASFMQWDPDARLRLIAARTKPTQQARVVSYLDLTGEEWSQQTQIDWSVKNGSTFSVECSLLAGWKVKHVRVGSANGGQPEPVQADWTLRQEANGRRVIVIDLPDSLRPDDPISITISAARAPQLRLRQLRFPVVRPLNCESVRHVLAVRHRSRPVLADLGNHFWKPIRSSEIPRFARGTEAVDAALADTEPAAAFFLSDISATPGFLSLNGGRPVADAQVWATVIPRGHRVEEKMTITVKPVGGPVRQVLVYFPTTDRKTVWSLDSVGDRAVTAQRQPRNRHKDWNLPDGGELWEVELKTPTSREFRIVVDRTADFSGLFPVDLAFVPEARVFRGFVELANAEGSSPAVSVAGLQSLTNPQAQLVHRPRVEGAAEPAGRIWSYQTTADQMTLRSNSTRTASDAIATASLKLVSVVSDIGGIDVHVGTFQIDPIAVPGRFQFTMPENAELIGVRLNGNAVKPESDSDGVYIVAQIPAGRVNGLEVRYRTPSAEMALLTHLRAAVPATSHTITGFQWHLAIPPRYRLAQTPTFGSLSRPISKPSWTTRFFGPIGRPEAESIFNPFLQSSWQERFESTRHDPQSRSVRTSSFAPAGWVTYEMSSATLVDPPAVEVWDQLLSRRIAWVVLLVCLTIGILMRRRRSRLRGRIAAYWMSLCLVSAWLVPGIYAEIVGSGLIGAVIAALIPRHLVRPHTPKGKNAGRISLGSTASYSPSHLPASLMLLGLLGTLAGTVGAHDAEQIPADDDERRPISKALKSAVAESGPFDVKTVVIPIDKSTVGKPSIVYLHKSLLTRLKASAAQQTPTSRFMIRSAEYRLSFDERTSAIVEARLHVDVLDPTGEASVVLPFRDVALFGADACRVDGRVQPVRRGRGGQGFVVDLAKVPEANERNRPIRAATPRSHRTNARMSPGIDFTAHRQDVPVAGYEIVMRFRVAFTGDQSAGHLKFGVPRIAASRLVFDASQRLAFAEISTARGRASISGDVGSSVLVELGRTDSVNAQWSVDARPKPTRAVADASVFTLVEAHPGYLEYRFRVQCKPRAGAVDSAVLGLPREFVVRQVQVVGDENGIDSFDLLPHDNQSSRMLVQLAEPSKEPFELDISATLPFQRSGPRAAGRAIPVFELFPKDAHLTEPSAAAITPVADHLGILSTPEFDLKPAAHDGAALSVLNAEDALNIESIPRGTKRLAFLYRVHRETRLPFQLIPRLPARTVRQHQEGRFHRGYLEWTMSAQVETSVAPAMMHRLTVDPRLRIDSITVIEDQAPRLIRWSRIGKRVSLFLANKTTETQSITLRARLPLPGPGEIQLPDIRFVDAITEASDVFLDRDPDCLVEFNNLPVGVKVEPAPNRSKKDGSYISVGAFRIDPGGTMPRLNIDAEVRRRRVDTLVYLDSNAAGKWTVATTLHLGERFRTSTEFRVRIPEALADGFKILPAASLLKTDRRPDDAVVVTLRFPRSVGPDRTVTIVSSLPESTRRDRVVPALEFLDAMRGENFLTLSTRMKNIAVVEPAETLVLEKSAGWIRTVLGERAAKVDGPVFRRDRHPWKLTRRKVSAAPKAYVALLETQVVPGEGTFEIGRTTALLVRSTDSTFDLKIPDGVKPRAALIDGRPVALKSKDANLVSIPLVSGRSIQMVVLHWQREVDPGRLPVRVYQREFPRPTAVLVRKSVLSATQTDSARILSSSGVDSISRLQFLIERIEGLLDGCEADDQSVDRRPVYWDTARRGYSELKRVRQSTELRRDEVDDSLEKRLIAVDRRFESLQRSLRGLPIPDDRAPSHESVSGALNGFASLPSDDQGYFAVWPADEREPELTYWTINLHVVYWVIGLLAFLVVTPFVRKIVKLETGDRLSGWEPISWAALGLIWWLCLTPSIVGIGLVLVGLVRTVVKRRKRTLHIGDSFQTS